MFWNPDRRTWEIWFSIYQYNRISWYTGCKTKERERVTVDEVWKHHFIRIPVPSIQQFCILHYPGEGHLICLSLHRHTAIAQYLKECKGLALQGNKSELFTLSLSLYHSYTQRESRGGMSQSNFVLIPSPVSVWSCSLSLRHLLHLQNCDHYQATWDSCHSPLPPFFSYISCTFYPLYSHFILFFSSNCLLPYLAEIPLCTFTHSQLSTFLKSSW